MIKKILLAGCIISLAFFSSCKSDDDEVKTLSIEEQNAADDAAIINFLDNYYFDDLGKVTKFSDTVTSDDKDPLSKNAKKDPSGFWYVVNAEASAGDGENPDGENNILIHYTLKYFTATEGGNGYTYLYTASSSIDNIGVAQENPFFYKKPENSTYDDNYYTIKGIVNGLKNFKPTGKGKNDPYDKLQGVIIVPSRLAYARNSNYLGLADVTFILNFELYKVCSGEQTCL
ncbi:MAG: hypothetical protein LBQ84_08300 [Flavobacteriaceae bacterium]|jgi:hypothetical protein|nr:hypothetical protein [Flavobacteriaceae bacterium]